MPTSLNGYNLSDDEIASMCQKDSALSYDAWKPHWDSILSMEKELYQQLINPMHRKGLSSFVPQGYSIAQALAARASTLSSIGMIIYDFDGATSQEGLLQLVDETYLDLLKAAICKPELLYGSRGLSYDMTEYEKEHGYYFLSCSMLGEPDWDECRIDYSKYSIEIEDPHDLIHQLSKEMFVYVETKKRVKQYINWADEDNVESHLAKSRITSDIADKNNEELLLYENTKLGIKNRKTSRKEQLDEETYLDIFGASKKAVMLAMAECERIKEIRDPSVGALKASIRKVLEHLRWFFDYYSEAKTKASY